MKTKLVLVLLFVLATLLVACGPTPCECEHKPTRRHMSKSDLKGCDELDKLKKTDVNEWHKKVQRCTGINYGR